MTDRIDTHPKDDPADDFATGQVPEADVIPTTAPPAPRPSRARFRAFVVLGLVVLVGAALFLLHMLTRSPAESTDDALGRYMGRRWAEVSHCWRVCFMFRLPKDVGRCPLLDHLQLLMISSP